MGDPRIVTMPLGLASSFHEALDEVARERRYLALLEAPPLETVIDFSRDIARGGFVQLVALEVGRVVGWCDVRRKSVEVFAHVGVVGMGVLGPYRRRGLGRALLDRALEAAVSGGAERLELDVFASNTAARRLYERAGFVLEGTRVRACKMDGRYEDILLMAKDTRVAPIV